MWDARLQLIEAVTIKDNQTTMYSNKLINSNQNRSYGLQGTPRVKLQRKFLEDLLNVRFRIP